MQTIRPWDSPNLLTLGHMCPSACRLPDIQMAHSLARSLCSHTSHLTPHTSQLIKEAHASNLVTVPTALFLVSPPHSLAASQVTELIKEALMLSSLRHPNVSLLYFYALPTTAPSPGPVSWPLSPYLRASTPGQQLSFCSALQGRMLALCVTVALAPTCCPQIVWVYGIVLPSHLANVKVGGAPEEYVIPRACTLPLLLACHTSQLIK